ncbi:di- and tricarboxylate transporter [Klebsiella pneumoniae]|uniref:Di- and tricarboxylate transporter n=1 Tax=Klebsiella pneumoniae TaxID=573 RepID=A0A3S4H9X4_KLEPN|nr:di- and tricarboxylate transporter [Klebsiella pneumoniae]
MRTCIYVAGILGLAIAVTQTGIGGAVGNALLQVMPLDKDNPFTSFLALDRDNQHAELYYDRQRRAGAVYHLCPELCRRHRFFRC